MKMNDHGTQYANKFSQLTQTAIKTKSFCFITFDLRISMHLHVRSTADRPTSCHSFFNWRNNGINTQSISIWLKDEKKEIYKWYTCCRAHTQFIIYAACDRLNAVPLQIRLITEEISILHFVWFLFSLIVDFVFHYCWSQSSFFKYFQIFVDKYKICHWNLRWKYQIWTLRKREYRNKFKN